MLFNSITYLFIFLPTVALLNWGLPDRLRLWLILLASLAFYGFWRIEFVPLLLFSAALDYVLALWIESTKIQARRRKIMLVSVAANLAILGVFKYLLFFRDTLWSISGWLGYQPSFVDLYVVLPLGISFYIFATISYVIDVYRREFKAERNFIVYCNFVVFFPHLVAGPILRARSLIPQLRRPAKVTWIDVNSGVSRILQGLFLKVVLADTIAGYVDGGFARDAYTLTALDAWTLAFLFGFQIYFDFAGYSHIAIGSARLFGIVLPENFNFPYLATSPRDFWQRWHISLSTWIRDYVYLPMVGNVNSAAAYGPGGPPPESEVKKTTSTARESQRTFSLYGTWALMGLWHGANWTFALWGIYHAVLVHGYRLVTSKMSWNRGAAAISWNREAAANWVSRAITFPLIMAGWIPFRTQSIGEALVMWGKMLDPSAYWGFRLAPDSYFLAVALPPCMVLCWLVWTLILPWFKQIQNPVVGLLVVPAQVTSYSILIMFDLVFLQANRQFIYFQF
jgi:alginate O-acetyltransferase complex protein AlgI